MKIRMGFVSNSSSSSFVITNKTKVKLTVLNFAKENLHLYREFNECYDYSYTEEAFLASPEGTEVLNPGENFSIFGDEDGTPMGTVFDYILRDTSGDESDRFAWRFKENMR